MKLTTDLIANSPSRINPVKDRELVLRDLKIGAIENLGATKDLNDTIDFTNNDLRVLGNFPRLTRLQHLLLANNRISKIDPHMHEFVPNLSTLILTNNSLQELGDLEVLAQFKKLTKLCLLDNPVAKKRYYRLYVIHKVPQLRLLDFNKIKQKEREEAKQLFEGTDGVDNDLAKSIAEQKSKALDIAEATRETQKGGQGLTADEQMKIKEALKQATSLDEISRLERVLKAGHVPNEKPASRNNKVGEEEEEE
ncbi:L domain-like protein [Radiomyces spectabilis]|uniref:L domain-like protein n=1 Tax=Radiomyces spectabilis TaxID=64574 RepID=UPI00221E86D5|nr:L domain-like protein [Radiomyces spectabilis]KAI8388128.1 L domain-like protein [Radiomyces spectabilis]